MKVNRLTGCSQGGEAQEPIALAIGYPGSKGIVMPRVVPHLPPHDLSVEVFGGTGAMTLKKPRSRLEVYNDLNGDLCNLFWVLQDEPKLRRLLRRLRYTPHSRQMFERSLRLLHDGAADDVDRAWAFLVVGNQARAGHDPSIAIPSAWGYQRKPSPRARWPLVPQYLERIAERFQGVRVEHRSWEDILRRYDSEGSLFLLDPPYPPEVRVSKRLYKYEMTREDHERLLRRVQQLRGLVILCSYDSELYRGQLAHWRRIDIPTRCFMSPAKPPRTEVAWMNFEYR